MESAFASSPIYPLITSLCCFLLYAGLFEFGYTRIVQKCYAWFDGSTSYRIQIYLLLTNLPCILLLFFGILNNNSLLPLDVTLKIDSAFILVISSYICYLEESRQTALRGFVFLKDTIFMVVGVAFLGSVYMGGTATASYALVMVPVYLVNLILQAYTNEIQDCLLILLGIRQKNTYRAAFLLTEKSHPSNFLEIKDIISTNEEKIQEQLDDFMRIATLLKKSDQELDVLANVARLFIPIKTAYEIHEELAKEKSQQQFQLNWEQIGRSTENEEELEQEDQSNSKGGPSFNQSASTLLVKRTFTHDSILDPEDISSERREEDQNYVFKVIKYSCYPIYLSMRINGRPRYFLDYFIVGLIACTMYLLSNSIAAFSIYLPHNRGLVSLVYSLFLMYPSASYFIRVSGAANDYDFLGIFMQGVIFKLTLFSLSLAVSSVGGGNITETGQAQFVSEIVRMGTYIFMAGYLIWKRFAMRYSNFRIFLGTYLVSELLKIIQQNIVNSTL